MKSNLLLFAVVNFASGIAFSEPYSASGYVALSKGDSFKCLPYGSDFRIANSATRLLTCVIAQNVESKAGGHVAIQKESRLIGKVHDQKISWIEIVTNTGGRISVQPKDGGGVLLASDLQTARLPGEMTVRVLRDLEIKSSASGKWRDFE